MKKIDTQNYNSLSFDYNFENYFNSMKDNDIFGNIHSIFDRVVNIYNGRVIIPIVKKDIGNGPYTLRGNFPNSFSFNELTFKKGDKVKKSKNALLFNDIFTLTILKENLWNYDINFIDGINSKIASRNYDILKEVLIDKGSLGGCGYYLLKNYIDIKPDLIEKELSKSIDKFILNVEDNTEEDLKSLIGLGIGLTPSGDDFLTGFITALSRIQISSNIYKKIIKNMKNIELSTTDISINMLNSASQGEAREEVLDFIYRFCENDIEKFEKSLSNLLEIGSSSGTDLAVGVALAYMYIVSLN